MHLAERTGREEPDVCRAVRDGAGQAGVQAEHRRNLGFGRERRAVVGKGNLETAPAPRRTAPGPRRSNSRRSLSTCVSNSPGERLSSAATNSASSASSGAPSTRASRSQTRFASNVPSGCSVSVAAVNDSGCAEAGSAADKRNAAASAGNAGGRSAVRRRRTGERIPRGLPSGRRAGGPADRGLRTGRPPRDRLPRT